MIFVRRQIASVAKAGVQVNTFFLTSRTNPLTIGRESFRLERLIAEFRPHVVHAQFGTVTALISAMVSRPPLVITFRGSDINKVGSDGALRSALGRLFSQVAALRAGRIVCVSTRLRDQIWWPSNKVTVQPNGVDMTLFQPMPIDEARATLSWPRDEPVVLFNSGGAPRVKRLDLATEAMGVVKRSLPHARLHVMNGDVAPADVPIYLNAANVLLVTSDSEGSPNIVRESLSCNLPIVSVDVGDVRERIEGVEPSCIVSRRPADIAREVCRVLGTGARSNGRASMERLSEEGVARRLVSIYEDLCHGASGPA
jgi:glycosyltransferase involved in cell wall biosynthesis